MHSADEVICTSKHNGRNGEGKTQRHNLTEDDCSGGLGNGGGTTIWVLHDRTSGEEFATRSAAELQLAACSDWFELQQRSGVERIHDMQLQGRQGSVRCQLRWLENPTRWWLVTSRRCVMHVWRPIRTAPITMVVPAIPDLTPLEGTKVVPRAIESGAWLYSHDSSDDGSAMVV